MTRHLLARLFGDTDSPGAGPTLYGESVNSGRTRTPLLRHVDEVIRADGRPLGALVPQPPVEALVGGAVLAGVQADAADLSGQPHLGREQQRRAEALTLPVGRDGDPANLDGGRIEAGDAEARDEAAVLTQS